MIKAAELAYVSYVAKRSFEWLYLNSYGKWDARTPREDELFEEARKISLRGKIPEAGFYIGVDESDASDFLEPGLATRPAEPDLFLRFASAQPTPETIVEFANQYGLISTDLNEVWVRGQQAKSISEAYSWPLTKQGRLAFYVESCSRWLEAFSRARRRVEDWSAVQRRRGRRAKEQYLNEEFNPEMNESLTLQLRMDPRTERCRAELVASSLGHLIHVQWGLAVVAHQIIRQCEVCTNWFGVHPAVGRSDKRYCSTACRMRAMRRRKSGSASG